MRIQVILRDVLVADRENPLGLPEPERPSRVESRKTCSLAREFRDSFKSWKDGRLLSMGAGPSSSSDRIIAAAEAGAQMAISELRGVGRSVCRVLIVEDEYFLAADLATTLKSHGAEIVGPIGDLTEAKYQVAGDGFDVVVLDINLRDEQAYGLADELTAREIPFVFLTGYGADVIPARFADVLRLEKPIHPSMVVQQVIRLNTYLLHHEQPTSVSIYGPRSGNSNRSHV